MKRFLIPVIFAILLSACATVKQPTKTVAVVPQQQEVLEEDTLSEEKQNEFEYLFIEGLKQVKLGNAQSAVSIFSKCLEIDPNSAATMFELAKIHVRNGDQTSSALLLEKAISINPDNKWYKIILARIYQQSKQYVKAANLYETLYKIDTDKEENFEYLYMGALMLSKAGKIDESIAAFDKLESKLGFNEQLIMAKEQVYLDNGDTEKAAGEINKLIDSNPEDTRYYGLMADMYMDSGDSIKALDYYNKILEIDPDNGFVQFSLAEYYRKINNLEKSYEHVKKGFKNEELDIDAKLQMFLMLTGSKKSIFTDKQTNELVGLLQSIYPDDYRVKALYVDILLQKNQIEEARTQLRIILDSKKDDYSFWERLMFIDNDLHDFESLYSDSKTVLELFPNQAVVYALNGVACLQLERYEEALSILKEGESYVQDNDPIEEQFALYKAEANYKLDRMEEAFKAFDEVIKVNPENYMALNNYAYYLSLRDENLEKAARMSLKAVQNNPQNATYLDTYAWVLFRQKDYKMAKFYQESALQYDEENNAVILEHYGDILFMLDEKEKAMEYWKEAAKTDEGTEFLKEKIEKGYYIEK